MLDHEVDDRRPIREKGAVRADQKSAEASRLDCGKGALEVIDAPHLHPLQRHAQRPGCPLNASPADRGEGIGWIEKDGGA
jgi:hypothetical protein